MSHGNRTSIELQKEVQALRAQLECERDAALRFLHLTNASNDQHGLMQETALFLRGSEKWFRDLAELFPHTVFELDLEGRILFVNRQALKMFGYSQVEIEAGVNCFQALAEHERDRARQNLLREVDCRYLGVTEYQVQRKDGTQFPVVIYRSPILRENTLVGMRGIVVDITDYKRAEEALWESEECFRSLIENAPEAVFVQSAGRFAYLNPAACRLFGASSPEELLGKEFIERMAPEYHDWIRERILFQRETGKCAPLMEQEYIRLDGSRIPVETTGVLIRYQGKDAHLVYIRDITERKRMAEALRETREFLEAAVSQSPSGIVIADAPDVRIRLANQAAISIRGGEEGNLTGIDVSQHSARWQTFRLDGSPYSSEQLPLSRAVLLGETTRDEELIIRDEQGNRHWIRANAAPLRNAAGQVTAGIAVFHDITERKQDESRLAELEMQLNHASRLATLGELAAGIAHEVNQPLCTIVNYAKACKNALSCDPPDLPKIYQWNDAIALAASRSGDIIRGMLGFARRHGSAHVLVDIGQLVADAMLLVGPEAKSRKIAMRQEMFDRGLAVCADPVQLHQVLVNLLRNAMDAFRETHPSDRRIEVLVRRVDGLVQVSISDNGTGLPEEERAKIFEPFFTTKPHGLGLGLSISKSIIEELRGKIWATANLSGGLTFHFTLPEGKDNPQDVSMQNGFRD